MRQQEYNNFNYLNCCFQTELNIDKNIITVMIFEKKMKKG